MRFFEKNLRILIKSCNDSINEYKIQNENILFLEETCENDILEENENRFEESNLPQEDRSLNSLLLRKIFRILLFV